jgi:hypothetical protein
LPYRAFEPSILSKLRVGRKTTNEFELPQFPLSFTLSNRCFATSDHDTHLPYTLVAGTNLPNTL